MCKDGAVASIGQLTRAAQRQSGPAWTALWGGSSHGCDGVLLGLQPPGGRRLLGSAGPLVDSKSVREEGAAAVFARHETVLHRLERGVVVVIVTGR